MIKPYQIFLLFFSVVIVLTGIILVFPSGKIPVGDTLYLNFFTSADLLSPGRKPEKVEISHIIEIEDVPPIDSGSQLIGIHINEISDNNCISEIEDTIPLEDIITVASLEFKSITQKIELPFDNQKPLENFFLSLDSVRIYKEQIRILHYGDSQLEGDRITSTLRKHFQNNKDFKGCGIGLVPLKENIHGRKTVSQKSSENLSGISVNSNNHNITYGLLGSVYKFSGSLISSESKVANEVSDTLLYTNDSLANSISDSRNEIKDSTPEMPKEHLPSIINVQDSGIVDSESIKGASTENTPKNTHSGWFSLNRNQAKELKSQQVNNIKLLYNNVHKPTKVNVAINGTPTYSDILLPTSQFTIKEWPIKTDYTNIKIEVNGAESPDFYGVSLDCESGISVDNIGLRGSSIINFSDMRTTNLSSMLGKMKAKLVVLQFGVNVVPSIAQDYKYYENMIFRQISALKKSDPDISVLVIGVSDMSRKNGLEYESYPNIAKIRDAQRNAAFRSGSAFWDLYEAMGGENSMLSWVQNKPAYAGKDYTHFNNRGAAVVGKMIYEALMHEYYEYKNLL